MTLAHSPLVPGPVPVKIYYRESGQGLPLVFLHGGWGYEIYPFNHQIRAFSDRFRILIPDRSGYGRSPELEELPSDFHARAAVETMRFLDALDLLRPVLWGTAMGRSLQRISDLPRPEGFERWCSRPFTFIESSPARANSSRPWPQTRNGWERVYAKPSGGRM